MTENAATKGRRLLVEGRIRLLDVDEDGGHVLAEVRGDSARLYRTTFNADEGWRCDCPTIGVCSHIRAVQLVVIVEPRERRRACGSIGAGSGDESGTCNRAASRA